MPRVELVTLGLTFHMPIYRAMVPIESTGVILKYLTLHSSQIIIVA